MPPPDTKGNPAPLPRSIFGYVRAYSWRSQLVVLALTFVSLPFFYFWVELPKRIVDDALGGGPGPRLLFGVELTRLDYLFALCLIFLALVIINGVFKYVINVYKGIVGERMLRRLRYELYSRVLRFPPAQFRVASQGQLVQMINAEVEPLGGFIGDAYSLPAYQGGMLLTILGFMFLQNPLMGLAAVIFYPLQIWIIPKLQAQVNALGRARVRQVRILAERIGESTSGVDDIRANDATAYERARFADELARVFFIRMDIYKKKFFIKFLNNFLAQLAPFLFYAVGGYLVFQGELTIGAILAIVAAHEKLAGPWKELLTYYQQMWDADIKYEQVVSQFDPPAMRPPILQESDPPAAVELGPTLVARALSIDDDGGGLDAVSFQTELPAHLSVLGPPDSGQHLLLRAIAGLQPVRPGLLAFGSHDVAKLPESVLGRRLAYVGGHAHLFAGSVRDNFLYGLKHRPLRPAVAPRGRSARERAEATASGNSVHDSAADWVDLAEAGVADENELEARLLEILGIVRLERDVYAFGLRGRIDPERAPLLASRVLGARQRFAARRQEDRRLARLVEGFDPERYNHNATLAENLLFGTPLDPAYEMRALPRNPVVRRVLGEFDLERRLRRVGYQLAETMVELFADLPPDHEYFRRFSFISADDLPDYKALVGRLDIEQATALRTGEDAERLLALPMQLITARHRLGLVDQPLQDRLVAARTRLREVLPAADRDKIAFFEPESYNRGASLQDNILFGRIALDQANAEATVTGQIAEIIEEMGLRSLVVRVGLDAEVGIGGARLPVAQRQKLALGRALVRRPDVLVLDNPTGVLDRYEEEALRDNLLAEMQGRTMIWSHPHPEWVDRFDSLLILKHGRVVAAGTPAQIAAPQLERSLAVES